MKKREGFDPLSLVSKIANQEKELTGSTFLAPYVGGGKVRLRLSGILYELEIKSCPDGWSIFQVTGAGKSEYLQRAPLAMVRDYLQLLPQVRLIAIDQLIDKRWWAVSADSGTQRIQLNGPVPFHLADRVASFETIYCRFDGANFWFESVDRRRDPTIARELRKQLAGDIEPEDLRCRGIVPQERLVYKMLFINKHKDRDTSKQLDDGTRISNALAHAGAQLDSFWYQDGAENNASVRFQLSGRTHVIQVKPKDLSIVSAGICLSGRDSDFDLSSLVGVLRELDDEYGYY